MEEITREEIEMLWDAIEKLTETIKGMSAALLNLQTKDKPQ